MSLDITDGGHVYTWLGCFLTGCTHGNVEDDGDDVSGLLCLVCSAEELYMLAEGAGLELQQMAGMVLNPVSGKWSLSSSVAVNYIAYFSKISLKDKLSRAPPVATSKAADLASS